MAEPKRVLILCTGNSCRSQMAEGLVNHELAGIWMARSAGTRSAERVHPLAVEAMAEVGIDISGGTPESVDRYLDAPWDLVITVCDSAKQSCPVFPGPIETLHVSFPDPADAVGSDEEIMNVFRAVRDDIRKRLVEQVRGWSAGAPSGPQFEVRVELEGWELFWAKLASGGDHSGLPEVRQRVVDAVRRRYADASEIAASPPIAALRKLFRAAGCDPTRYRPSSEALLRRLVKGADLPAIHPLVDVNNCLSAELGVPCCVMREGSFGSHLVFRAGVAGEKYESLRGPFNLENKPLLVDETGPVDAPITGSTRVMVEPATSQAWMVAYLPVGVVTGDDAQRTLGALARDAGVEYPV